MAATKHITYGEDISWHNVTTIILRSSTASFSFLPKSRVASHCAFLFSASDPQSTLLLPMSLVDFADLFVLPYKDSEARAMEAIDEDNESSLHVPFVMMPPFPLLKYHDGPLHFLSQPQVTQDEYERRVIRQGPSSPSFDDEEITIRCPDGASSAGPRIFRIARSGLSRSPYFQEFFQSSSYRPHCSMLITFMRDPASVFDLVKRYLEEGPERFNLTILRIHVHYRYHTLERIMVLVRLCRMTHHMDLWHLHDMAYEALVGSNRFVYSSMLPSLAGVIFASREAYNSQLKDWCLMHISHHFMRLRDDMEWIRCLETCEEELRAEWIRIASQCMKVLAIVDDRRIMMPEDREAVLEDMIGRMSALAADRAISVLSERQSLSTPPTSPAPTITPNTTQPSTASDRDFKGFTQDFTQDFSQEFTLLASTPADPTKSPNGDRADGDDWEEVGPPTPPTKEEDVPPSPSSASTSMSDRTILGTAILRKGVSSHKRSHSEETAKARQVMGIDKHGVNVELNPVRASLEPAEADRGRSRKKKIFGLH